MVVKTQLLLRSAFLAIGALTTLAAIAPVTVACAAFAAFAVVVGACIAVSLRRFARRQACRCLGLWRVVMAWALIATVFTARSTFTTWGFATAYRFASIAVFFTSNAFVVCFSTHLGLSL